MMKIKNTFVLILLIVNICNAQNDIFNIKKADLIITESIDSLNVINEGLLYSKQSLTLFKVNHKPEDMGRYELHKLIFVNKQKDTMIIEPKVQQCYNYYYKNMKFKKGHFLLEIRNLNLIVKKRPRLKKLKEFDSKLILNSVNMKLQEFEDVYFKNLKFHVIDLSDTKNISLEKI